MCRSTLAVSIGTKEAIETKVLRAQTIPIIPRRLDEHPRAHPTALQLVTQLSLLVTILKQSLTALQLLKNGLLRDPIEIQELRVDPLAEHLAIVDHRLLLRAQSRTSLSHY
jgi:hypothetical protein